MKNKITIAIAGFVITTALFVTLHGDGPSELAPIIVTKVRRPVQKSHDEIQARIEDRLTEAEPSEEKNDSAAMADWLDRFDVLVKESGSREEAVRLLLIEMDAVYGAWVESQIALLAELPPSDRYDRLAEIESMIREGAASILELVEVEGARHVSVLAGSLDAVSAEIRYAETAPDHKTRMALLALDRERESLMGKVLISTDEAEKSKGLSALESWYDAKLCKIFPSDEIE